MTEINKVPSLRADCTSILEKIHEFILDVDELNYYIDISTCKMDPERVQELSNNKTGKIEVIQKLLQDIIVILQKDLNNTIKIDFDGKFIYDGDK